MMLFLSHAIILFYLMYKCRKAQNRHIKDIYCMTSWNDVSPFWLAACPLRPKCKHPHLGLANTFALQIISTFRTRIHSLICLDTDPKSAPQPQTAQRPVYTQQRCMKYQWYTTSLVYHKSAHSWILQSLWHHREPQKLSCVYSFITVHCSN